MHNNKTYKWNMQVINVEHLCTSPPHCLSRCLPPTPTPMPPKFPTANFRLACVGHIPPPPFSHPLVLNVLCLYCLCYCFSFSFFELFCCIFFSLFTSLVVFGTLDPCDLVLWHPCLKLLDPHLQKYYPYIISFLVLILNCTALVVCFSFLL
jgi:hypothetical protein